MRPTQRQQEMFIEHMRNICKDGKLCIGNANAGPCLTKEISRILSEGKYQISSIELRQNPLRNEGISILAEGLAKTKSVVHLDLRSTAFTRDGAIKLFKSLMNNQSINCLYIGNFKGMYRNFLSEITMNLLGDYIKKSMLLTFLDLKGAGIGNNGAKMLLDGLKATKTLKVLNLAFNNLTAEGSMIICDIITLTSIKRLDLSQNSLGNLFRAELARIVIERQIPQTHLSFSSCGFSSPGIIDLLNSFKRGPYLSYLELDEIKYEEKEMDSLKWFIANSSQLNYLSCARCKLGDAGAKLIGDALLENTGLEYLNLARNSITSAGASHLADKLTGNRIGRLNTLDLSNNLIDVF